LKSLAYIKANASRGQLRNKPKFNNLENLPLERTFALYQLHLRDDHYCDWKQKNIIIIIIIISLLLHTWNAEMYYIIFSLPGLAALQAEGSVIFWVTLFSVVSAQFGRAILKKPGRMIRAD
jgi:hypothetical protein